MGKNDPYIEWNAFQILLAELPKLVDPKTVDSIKFQLTQLLQPSEIDTNLRRNILIAWKTIQPHHILVDTLKKILSHENVNQAVRLEGIPNPGTPIAIGPLYCCPKKTCSVSMFQLFEGQQLICPKHKQNLVTCKIKQKRGKHD